MPRPTGCRPPCPHARPGGCGGCDWQHASLPAQRSLKAAVVRQQLRRIAGIDREVIVEPMPGDETGLGWRTRVKYAVGPAGGGGPAQAPVARCHGGRRLPDRSSAGHRRRGDPASLAGRGLGRGRRRAGLRPARGDHRPGRARRADRRGLRDIRPQNRPRHRLPAAASRGTGLAGQREGVLAGPSAGGGHARRRGAGRAAARSRGRQRSTCTAGPGCSPGCWPEPSARPGR